MCTVHQMKQYETLKQQLFGYVPQVLVQIISQGMSCWNARLPEFLNLEGQNCPWFPSATDTWVLLQAVTKQYGCLILMTDAIIKLMSVEVAEAGWNSSGRCDSDGLQSDLSLSAALVQQKSVRRMLEVLYSCLTFDDIWWIWWHLMTFDDIWWQFVVCVWYMRVSQAWDPWPLRHFAVLPGIRDGQECRIIDHVRLSATKAFWGFSHGFPKMGDPHTIGCHPKISKPSLISKWGNS